MSSSLEPTSTVCAVQPSDGANISTEERAFIDRKPMLIINIASTVLGKALIRNLPSGQNLRAFLISNNSNLEELHRRRIITAPQMDLLQSNCPDLEKFDVTLLVCLLRNIVNVQEPARGWSTTPDPLDTSFGADLLRVRNWQNRIRRSSADGMLNEEFNQLWNEVEAVLVRMTPEGEERNYIRKEIAEKSHNSTFDDVDTKDVKDQLAELQLADAPDARLEGGDLGNVKKSCPPEEAIKVITNQQPDGRQQSSVPRPPVSTNSTNYGGDHSLNVFGGKLKTGTMNISSGTGSSIKRTVPEHGSGVRMADGSVNYGGTNSQNLFNADVEAEKVCTGQPEASGYDEIDTVQTTDHKPGPTTSLAGDSNADQDITLEENIHDASIRL